MAIRFQATRTPNQVGIQFYGSRSCSMSRDAAGAGIADMRELLEVLLAELPSADPYVRAWTQINWQVRVSESLTLAGETR